jgi:hypothetical protein
LFLPLPVIIRDIVLVFWQVFFAPEIAVAFCYDGNIFVPEAVLTRELVVRVLNVSHSHLEGASDDSYSCLMQAIFETLPAGGSRQLEVSDLTKAIDRAKSVQIETRTFLSNPASSLTKEAAMPNTSFHLNDKPPNGSRVEDDCDVEDLTDAMISPKSTHGRSQTGNYEPTTAADLKNKIQGVTRKCKHNNENAIIPASEFEKDNAGEDSCLRPASSLQEIPVDNSLGGGSLFCDAQSANEIKNGEWNVALRSNIAALRGYLDTAIVIVRESIPSLHHLLIEKNVVRPGFDGANDDYEGFCNETHIIINLHAFRPKLKTAAKNPRSLIHDLVLVVTHELAHLLEPRAGHGPEWRDMHMKMLVEVMTRLESKNH